MPSKRTRDATRRQQPSVDGSNATDYLGPPSSKRQNHGNNEPASSAPRMTRSAGPVQTQGEEPQLTGVTTRQRTRQRGNDEDDDDGSIHVNFNQAILAINEARSRERQTVNGVRFVDQQVDKATAPNPPGTRSSQQTDAKWHGKQKRKAKPVFQSHGERGGTDNELGASTGLSERDVRAQRRAATHGEGANTEPEQDQPQEQSQGQSMVVAPQQNRQDEDAASSSDEEDDNYLARRAAEQEAFTEAPQADEEVVEVEVSVPSLGGMMKILQHVAWSGKIWDESSLSRCRSASGRALVKHAQALKDLLVQATAAPDDSHEEDINTRTTEHLRNNTESIIRCFTSIGQIIEKICTQDLAPGENLTLRAIKARADVLRDISKRLIPILVLVMGNACDLVPSASSGSRLRLRFNSFTLQFFLRAVRWANLLEQSLSLGLEAWPVDKEFKKSDQELSKDEAELKARKSKVRAILKQQLSKLQSIAEKAKEDLQTLKRQAAQKRRNESMRQQLLASQQELRAARERQETEEKRRNAARWEALCKHTQDLKNKTDPLKAIWDRAEEVRQEYTSSQVALVSSPVQGRMQPSQNDVRAEPHGNRTMIDLVHNEDPFASDQDEGGLFVDRPVRNTNEPERENSQDGFTHPEHGEWDGLDWDGKEEEILSRAIYRNKYELVSMAERLNRTPYDVWRKASWFKKLFRDNYRDKGEQIPNWWW